MIVIPEIMLAFLQELNNDVFKKLFILIRLASDLAIYGHSVLTRLKTIIRAGLSFDA